MMWRWVPAAILGIGGLFTVGIDPQRSLQLREPLAAAIPLEIAGYRGRDVTMDDAEARVVGVSDYLLRAYQPIDAPDGAHFTLYVGYYEQQTHGRTIHSPKNCLPGAGWEPLAARTAEVETSAGPVVVNRYLLQHGAERALVLYWYQGRGRVAANEYQVKLDLLRDAALKRRSDEALVRIVVPLLSGAEADADALAESAARTVVPAVYAALPT